MNETNPTTFSSPTNLHPSHEDISRRAQDLWENYGRPSGRDEEIWLEAERSLQNSSPRNPPLSGGEALAAESARAGERPSTAAGRPSTGSASPKSTSVRSSRNPTR